MNHQIIQKGIVSLLLVHFTVLGFADDKIIVARSQGSITFVVDKNLPPLKQKSKVIPSIINSIDMTDDDDLSDEDKQVIMMLEQMETKEEHDNMTKQFVKSIFLDEKTKIKEDDIIITSFSDDLNDLNLKYFGKDSFYQSIIYAYANHMSITLSPDMIWLLISQGFARYVNAHAEELRYLFVDHVGKMDLVIKSEKESLREKGDWPQLLDSMVSEIGKYTKGNIEETMTADFTTTNIDERIVSQITLMECMKAYFKYTIRRLICGIPNITLKGTPDDWKRVLAKTKRLEKYAMKPWIQQLKPILKEFIHTAEGHPDQRFWKSIVKKETASTLQEGAGCGRIEPTVFDGWILKFFPDEHGNTYAEFSYKKEMPSERVNVDFKYQIVDGGGKILSETPMKLWAGFFGADVNTVANMLTPKIGWLVTKATVTDDSKTLEALKFASENMDGINIRVNEVPDIIRELKHIYSLNIEFTDSIRIPQWLDQIPIEHFRVSGKCTDTERLRLKFRFPNIIINDM